LLILRICKKQECGVPAPQVVNDSNSASLAFSRPSPTQFPQTSGPFDDVTSVWLFKQVQLQLAMILRAQQTVDLIGINRGFDELKEHAGKYPIGVARQWRIQNT
jgi:hypothetical protein